MTLDELIKEYKSHRRIAKTFGFADNTPLNWRKNGFIPLATQVKIEWATNGKFKSNIHDVPGYED